MNVDVARHLESVDLSEETVMAITPRQARKLFAPIRAAFGLTHDAVRLTSDPSSNVKLAHSETDRVAAYGLNLLPSDALQAKVNDAVARSIMGGVPVDALSLAVYLLIRARWNTCRFASPGCRMACLNTSGQARIEANSHKDRLVRARGAKLMFLLVHPAAFVRLLVLELDGLPARMIAELVKLELDTAGWTASFRANVLSDLPWESFAPWVLARATQLGISCYDYTAWPTSKRSRDTADSVGLYLADSVKETHTDEQIAAMARPVVVVDVKRGHELPTVWRGRPAHDADRSDARFLDAAGSVSLLRFKLVATCSRAEALTSGFVKVA